MVVAFQEKIESVVYYDPEHQAFLEVAFQEKIESLRSSLLKI